MSDAPTSDLPIITRIAWLLRAGVIVSALLLLIGGGGYLIRHGNEPVPNRRTFQPQPPELSRSSKIVRHVLSGRGRAIIQFALLLLIATPVLRVAYTVPAFALRRDWVYVVISAFVLLILLLGLAFARLGR